MSTYLELSNLIDDYGIGMFTVGEYAILRMLLNWTVRRGKTANSITYDQIADGIVIDGETAQAGTGWSSATISKHIKNLCKTGVVMVNKVAKSGRLAYSEYRINVDKLKEMIMERFAPKPRARRQIRAFVPENLNTCSNTESEENEENTASKNEATTKNFLLQKLKLPKEVNTNNNRVSKDTHALRARPSFDTVAEAATAAIQKTGAARARRAAKAAGRLTKAGLCAMWHVKVLESYKGTPQPYMTDKEFHQAKARITAFTETHDLSALMEWAIVNWDSIKFRHFVWLRKKGEDISPTPDFSQFILFFKVFVNAYTSDSMKRQAKPVTTEAEVVSLEKKLKEKEHTIAVLKGRLEASDRERKHLWGYMGRATPPAEEVKEEFSLDKELELAHTLYAEPVDLPLTLPERKR